MTHNTVINNLSQQNKIMFFYHEHVLNINNTIIMMPKNNFGQYQFFVDPTFWDSLGIINTFTSLLHELQHLLYDEMGMINSDREGEEKDPYQHRLMIERGDMDEYLHQVFPGKSDEFYYYVKYGGTGGDAYEGLSKKEIRKIQKGLDKYDIK